MPAPRDTSPEIWQRYLAAMRAMTPAERLARALQMSDSIREIGRDGISAQYPQWSADEVQAELERRTLGPALADTVRGAKAAIPR